MFMEHCWMDERADKDTFRDPTNLYLHLIVIYDLGVLIPFTYFETKFFTIINEAPYQITPNVWGILRAIHSLLSPRGVPFC